MLGNFIYSNPTKLYFGENSLTYLNDRSGGDIIKAVGSMD